MNNDKMDLIDPDYAQYSRGEITRLELYKRWKRRHTLGLLRALARDFKADWRALRRELTALFHPSA